MRKILIFILLLLPLSIVFAKTEISQEEFKNYMNSKKYLVSDMEVGSSASNENEEYVYANFNDAIEAESYFKKIYEDIIDNPKNRKLSSYNLENNNENTNYSMVEYVVVYEETNTEVYHYAYRIENSVIYGNSDLENKEKIKQTIEELIDDSILEEVAKIQKEAKESTDTENIEEQKDKKEEEKKEVENENHSSINIILISIIVVAALALILSIVKFFKK